MECTEMAAAFAHEIKNPTAVALAHVNLLRRDGMSEIHLNHIEDALHDINDLVVEMLTDIPEGIGREAAYEVDLLKILEEILEIYRAAWPHIAFSLELPPSAESLLCIGNETSLRMIFSNLIKNAVEAVEAFGGGDNSEHFHTKAGEIRIAARYAADALYITITDNGSFKPHAPKPGGSGLGLAICRNLAGGIGANLHAERTDSGGLAVSIMLLRRATYVGLSIES